MLEDENLELSVVAQPSDFVSECCGAEIELDYMHLSEGICTKCKKECDYSLDNND